MTMNELRGNCWVVFFWKQAALTMSFMVYAVKLSKTKYPNWVALLWLSDSEPYWSFVLVTWLFGFAWSFKLVCLSSKHAAEVRYKWNDVQDKYKHHNNYRNGK